MKDKYDKFFYQNEEKKITKENVKIRLLKLKYCLSVLNKSGLKDFKLANDMSINCMVRTLSTVNGYWQEWIKKNVINIINPQILLLIYISCLNYFLTTQQYNEIESVMKSFKISGLIKDIKFDRNKGIFHLLTLNGESIKFTKQFTNENDILKYNKYCHAATEALCITQDNVYAVTVMMKSYFDRDYYHSFIVKDGIVHDFAQNIVMSFKSYQKLFGCQIIMSMDGKQLLRNIERLKGRDNEYKENKMYDVLKYAMYKQMKHGKNIARH